MIPYGILQGMKGSVVRVDFNESRANYSLTGVLDKVVINKVILKIVKTGRTYRIDLSKVRSLTELSSGLTVLNFLQDGSGAASSLKEK